MSFFSSVPETLVRFGGYVAEFKELFRKNEVSFGKAADFFQLAPKLAYDDEFRTAFAGLTESVKKREDGKLTLTRMLTIIAIAMGGPEIETLSSASAVPISLVVVFLAGVGGWRETEPEIVTKAPQEQASGDVNAPAADRSVAAVSKQDEEREAEALEQRLASGSSHNLSELTASLFPGPAQVKEALSRLELNTLELKYHLDSIDQKIERIEPHLDQIATRIEPPPDARPRSEGDGRPRAMLEELAADEALFRARKRSETGPVEADVSNVVDRSAVEAMLRAAELKCAEPIEEKAPFVVDTSAVEAILRAAELEKAGPTEEQAPFVVDTSAVEAILRAAELEKAGPTEEQAPFAVDTSAVEAILRAAESEKAGPTEEQASFAVDTSAVEAILRAADPKSAEPIKEFAPEPVDTFSVEAMLRAAALKSAKPKKDVGAPVVEERKAVVAKVPVEPFVESPKVETFPVVAPVVIANKYESVRVKRLHRMIAVLGVLLFLLVGLAAALLYRDRDWLVQTLLKNRRVDASLFASDGKAGLPSPDRRGGTSSKVPTQLTQRSSLVSRQREPKSSGNSGQGELSGGRANGPTDAGSNRKFQDQTVMNQAQERGQAKQPPALESAPAKIPSTEQDPPPALAAAGPGLMVAGLPGSASGSATGNAVTASAPEAHIFRISSWAMSKNLIDSPKPAYPPGARFQRVEGDVVVRVLISENGTIEKATAVTGPQPLRGAAESAMRQWRYKPYIVDGKPVKVQTEMNFHFTLKPE